MKIEWQDKILEFSIELVFLVTILYWSKHKLDGQDTVCMSDHMLPKVISYREMQNGKWSQSSQKKRFKDKCKTALQSFGIIPDT